MQTPVDNPRIRLSSVGNPIIINQAPIQMDGEIASSDLKIQYRVSAEINRPQSIVNVIVLLTYITDSKTLFSGSLTTTFNVVDLPSYITVKEGEDKFRIESDFLPTLISIAFSTTRGYYVRELQGTILAPYPFPMISIDSLLRRVTYKLI